MGREVKLADSEIDRLMEYDWPGNVRELRNILERSVLLHKGPVIQPSEILIKEIDHRVPALDVLPAGDKITTLNEMEKTYIKYVLGKLSGNYTKTAKALGIALSTLKRKIKDYGLK
jgi:transcriptional regulator with PAS, ATPase and Fis domain